MNSSSYGCFFVSKRPDLKIATILGDHCEKGMNLRIDCRLSLFRHSISILSGFGKQRCLAAQIQSLGQHRKMGMTSCRFL